MFRRSGFLLLLLPIIPAACASAGETPSLAPRPMEYELSGRPIPPCLTAGAEAAPPAPVAAAPAEDAELAARIEALVATARAGQRDFAEILSRAQASSARAGAAGSESWIAAQLDVSRLEAARARTAGAAAELDALILARSDAPATNPDDLQRLTAAAEEVRALAAAQEAEIDRLNRALSGSSALRREPWQAPHNAQRRPAARQALAASDRVHISPGAPPKAGRTGYACRG